MVAKSHKTVVCFTAPRDQYQAAVALAENHSLECLVSDNYFPSSLWEKLPFKAKRYFTVRKHSALRNSEVVLSRKASFIDFARQLRLYPHEKLNVLIDKAVGEKAGLTALKRQCPLLAYSYQAGAAFRLMKGSGLPKICFQVHPSPNYLRKLHLEDMEIEPLGKASLMTENEMFSLGRKDLDDGPALADALICASSFTGKSLVADGAKAPFFVAPYGVDASQWVCRTTPPPRNSPFTIAFMGVLSQRKGARYLLKALARFPKGTVKLMIITRGKVDASLFQELPEIEVEVKRGLSNEEAVQCLHQADIFALPSIAEGFGLVILESMACGLPVLVTDHTGGPDVMEHGRHGFVVPIRSVDSIAQVIEKGLQDRELFYEMGLAARKNAEQRDWAKFREDMSTCCARALKSVPSQ